MPENEFELYLELLGKFLRLRPQQRTEIADELRDHLEVRLEELARGGMSRAEAVRRTLDEFGDAASLADHFSQLAQARRKRFLMRCTFGTVTTAALMLIVATALWPHSASMRSISSPSFAQADSGKGDAGAKTGGGFNPAATTPADERVHKKLDEAKMKLEFLDTAGRDALDHLRQTLEVDFVYANDVADELTMPVNLNVQFTELTGRAALQLVVDQIRLSFLIRDGVVQILRPEATQIVAVYDTAPFLGDTTARAAADGFDRENEYALQRQLLEELVQSVVSTVQPNSWQQSGGTGSITSYNGMLIVRNRTDVVADVSRLMEQLGTQFAGRKKASKWIAN